MLAADHPMSMDPHLILAPDEDDHVKPIQLSWRQEVVTIIISIAMAMLFLDFIAHMPWSFSVFAVVLVATLLAVVRYPHLLNGLEMPLASSAAH